MQIYSQKQNNNVKIERIIYVKQIRHKTFYPGAINHY